MACLALLRRRPHSHRLRLLVQVVRSACRVYVRALLEAQRHELWPDRAAALPLRFANSSNLPIEQDVSMVLSSIGRGCKMIF